jgi:transcriptional regulator with XRE-family HTH domain
MASALTPRTVGPVVMRESEQIAAQRVALGRCLASHRDRSGLSQQELAERLYYDRTSISKIETGQQPAPRVFWCEADRLLSADGELVAGFDALASAKAAAMASRGHVVTPTELQRRDPRPADTLADTLTSVMLPVARTSDRVRSTSASTDQIDTVIELEALSRTLAEHSRRVLMGESVDWAQIADGLRTAAMACQRHVVIEPYCTTDSRS